MSTRDVRTLRVASCMAQNADSMCRALTRHLGRHLNMRTEFVDDVPWQERERLLDAGAIDLCWICGFPYVEKVDRAADIELCVAPVMKDPRYADSPVYYSDVIVKADSDFAEFADIRGLRWAYNEPRSHSGYHLVRYELARRGHTLDYFGARVEAGSHQAALRLVIAGDVASAAIDSTVLEAEIARMPGLANSIRRLATFGPSPAPPWVVSTKLPMSLREDIRGCLESMALDARGQRVLDMWRIAELRPVNDAGYDAIRVMSRIGAAGTMKTSLAT